MSQPIYRFTRLISKYSNPVVIELATDGGYDEDTGEYLIGQTEEVTIQGAIMPLKSKQIYQSGGRLTEMDRIIYSLTPLTEKQHVVYKGKVYSVEAFDDYSDFGDFYYYLLKAVSAFA